MNIKTIEDIAKAAYKKSKDADSQLAQMANNEPLAEYTVDVAFPSGTPVADPGTDVITLVGHGFVSGDVLEIAAGAGAIPGGLTPINNVLYPSVHGKVFVYCTKLTNDTFQIYNIAGTTTPIDITSAGTEGWTVRKAGVSQIDFSGLSLNTINKIKVAISSICATQISTNGNSIFRVNNITDNIYNFYNAPNSYGLISYRPTGDTANKFALIHAVFEIDRMSAYVSNVSIGLSYTQRTNDFSTFTNSISSVNGNGRIHTEAISDITSLQITFNNAHTFLNGTVVKLERC